MASLVIERMVPLLAERRYPDRGMPPFGTTQVLKIHSPGIVLIPADTLGSHVRTSTSDRRRWVDACGALEGLLHAASGSCEGLLDGGS